MENTKAHSRVWSTYDSIHLIDEMYHLEEMPSNDYDWKVFSKRFTPAKTGPRLSGHWKDIVKRHVPRSKQMSQRECVDYLYRYHLPNLLASKHVSLKEAIRIAKHSAT